MGGQSCEERSDKLKAILEGRRDGMLFLLSLRSSLVMWVGGMLLLLSLCSSLRSGRPHLLSFLVLAGAGDAGGGEHLPLLAGWGLGPVLLPEYLV